MESTRKEPYATQEEFNKRVIRYRDVPILEVAPGIKVQPISAEKVMVVFATMEPNAQVPLHHHEGEQITMVMDGAVEYMVEGKIYPLKEGDVAIIPPGIEHGAYVSDRGCRTIEAFSPPRWDYVAKLEALKKGLKT